MDELRDFIQQNKGLFDDKQPIRGHEQRFLQKLEQQNNKRDLFTVKSFLKVAVVSLLFILSGLYVKDKLFTAMYNTTAEMIVPENEELKEAEQYYQAQINTQITMISNNNRLSEEQQQMLENEMKTIDNLTKQLQKDLKAMPNDPRIIQAIIQHYKIKLQVLNRIVNDLNKINNVKQLSEPNNEKISL